YAKGVGRKRLIPLLFALLVGACAEQDPLPITLVVTSGQEKDAFIQAPAPERFTLRLISVEGAPSQLLQAPWPSQPITLEGLDTNQLAAFEGIGSDIDDVPVMRGATILHPLWAVGAQSLPLFMGRVGKTSRPDGVLPFSHVHGLSAIVSARFIVSAGGTEAYRTDGSSSDPAAFSVYDVGLWQASTATGTLPRMPRAMAMVQGRWALVIEEQGASWFDFSTFESTEVAAPEALTFADIAGGQTVYGEQGEAYVVGPTRKDLPSNIVLRVDWQGTLTVIRLGVPRVAVAATYVKGRGLLLVGGHPSEPGALLLAPGVNSFSPLAYPPDPVQGAMATSLDDERVVLAGGAIEGTSAPTRILDLRCSTQCHSVDLAPSVKPIAIVHGLAHTTRADEVLLVGEDGSDSTTKLVRIAELDGVAFSESVVLHEPRVGAASVPLFGRMVAIVGGRKLDDSGVPSVEVYIPK
ncbi:MAG TPA: hypothetical protein PLV85_02025, partial [Polyangiaceae bacterium]|nr:hypothetical protein [Polyangiaceae bacterium]